MSTPIVDDAGRATRGAASSGDWPPAARSDGPGSRLAPVPQRRSAPHLLVGALLVVVCAAGAAVAGDRLSGRESVLALARPVQAGQVLAVGDVRAVEVAAGSDLELLAAAAASGVVGRPVAFALPAGTLLTRGVLGPARAPAAGEAVAAVGLKPGQFPPELEPGARVAVLVSAGGDPVAGSGPVAGTSWAGTVVAVQGGAGDQTTVVSVRMSEADARAVAAAPAGQLSVVIVGGES